MRDELLERLLSQREWLGRFARDLVREPSLAEDVVRQDPSRSELALASGDSRKVLLDVP